jgi:GTP cyclohydrolase I
MTHVSANSLLDDDDDVQLDNELDGDYHTALDLALTDADFLRAFQLDLPPVDHSRIEAATNAILEAVGEDPQREGLMKTPQRVARAYDELLSGYRTNPSKLLNGALFSVDYTDMVIVRDIEFASLCEHHMLPFYGHAHVAYIPNGKVIGLSKIPRVVDMFARRLQVQERMTHQIAEFLQQVLNPCGVAVVLEGVHMCAMIRGVKKMDSSMTTSAMLGVFANNPTTRGEFMAHINRTVHPH